MNYNSKHLGNRFESVVKNICNMYKMLGIAEIYKENDSKGYKEKLRVDFVGWVIAYNHEFLNRCVPIGVECKSVSGNKFNFKNIKPHQLEYLERLALVGGISLILIEFRNTGVILKVTIKKEDVIENKNFVKLYKEKKSINYEELKEISEIYNIINNLDFLNTGDMHHEIFKKYI